MKHCAFYHKESGVLHPRSVLLSDDKALEANTPADHVAMDQPPTGPLDPLSQRIDIATGKIMDYQPPQPSADHEWNATTKRWTLTADAQALISQRATARREIQRLENSQHRAVRDHLLGSIGALDRLKTIEEQIVAYRKDL